MDYPGRRYVLLLPLALAAMLIAASITGYIISSSHSHKERLDVLVNSSTESLSWSPETPGDLGYVKLTGSIEGNGSARVYLQRGGERYLILDSSQLPGGPPLEGMLTGMEPNQTAPSNEISSNETAPGEPAPGDGTTREPENETKEPSNPALANESDSGPAEEPTETRNVSANLTEPVGGENQTGANVTGLNETANVTAPGPNETGQINETTLPGNVTENITGPEGNESLPPGNATDNITEPEGKEPPVEGPPGVSFEDVCIETCSLEGFTEDSYVLAFDIEPGTSLTIETIEYSLRAPAEENVTAPENATNVTNVTMPGNITEPPPGNVTNVTLPGNVTELMEANLTLLECIRLNRSIQLLYSDLMEMKDMRERGFGMHTCNSTRDCNGKISSMASGGIITLDGPLSCSGDCLRFSGCSNIILDCMGRAIEGNGSGTGISLENSTYVMIKNCDVSGFERGIFLDGDSDFNIITDTRTSSNERDITVPSSVSNIFNNIKARITVSGR